MQYLTENIQSSFLKSQLASVIQANNRCFLGQHSETQTVWKQRTEFQSVKASGT